MKKHIFLATIIFILLIIIGPTKTLFADTITNDPSPSISPIITMENKEIQYDLPYPGLLPNNPLYFLKAARDKIIAFFISDPAKKAQYDLQQADKRINMGIYLSHDRSAKDALVSSSVSKALNYFGQAVTETQQARQQGQDIQSFVLHMDMASQKYHQVILQLQTNASSSLKSSLDAEQLRLTTIRNTVVNMEKK